MRCLLALARWRRASSSWSFFSPSRLRRSACATAVLSAPGDCMVARAVSSASCSRKRASAKRPAASAAAARSTSPAARRRSVESSSGAGASSSPAVLFESLAGHPERVLGGGAFLREVGAGRDLGLHGGLAVPGSLDERVDGGEGHAGVELVPAGGAAGSLSGEPVVLRAQVLRPDGGACCAGRPLGGLRRVYLTGGHAQPALEGLVGGAVVVDGGLCLGEPPESVVEEVASAGYLLAGQPRVGGEVGRCLVELAAEAGAAGLLYPRLQLLFAPLVEQRTLGLQVAGDEPLLLPELVHPLR